MRDHHISVPSPCAAKWSDMTPDGNGRFCDLCEKKVHDFRGKDKQYIIRAISASEQKICGYFDSRALQQEQSRWISAFRKSRWTAFIGVAIAFIIASCKTTSTCCLGTPVISEYDTLFTCNDIDPKTLQYMHKPNINEWQKEIDNPGTDSIYRQSLIRRIERIKVKAPHKD